MTYTVETIRQALLDQGITEVHFGGKSYPVATTSAEALLYITITNNLKEHIRKVSPDDETYLDRTVQALQMFGQQFMEALVEEVDED